MATLQDLKTLKKITWCPGCGNFSILSAFKNALLELGLEREQVTIVSGIGCHGKMVNYVNVNGFHGIHGRVLPLASGIKLANPELFVIGFAGDADQYDEGWDHFGHTVRRNIDMTLIVHDNQVLGLTTGQTTSTSLEGFRTKSTPFGSVVRPLNPVATALVCHGTFVARGFAGDPKHLQSLIVEAIKHSPAKATMPDASREYLRNSRRFIVFLSVCLHSGASRYRCPDPYGKKNHQDNSVPPGCSRLIFGKAAKHCADTSNDQS